ncbi:hypothetical protein EWH08_16610 [Sphingobium indicum]|uniref:Uncharacterized protein n=1 Tax=Sphingobium indicum TaxID=332055 RepID=A0A4Q4IXV0_9SPHN|nr:hypothetical protein EWH08_16610 [Sphingobium indicum]
MTSPVMKALIRADYARGKVQSVPAKAGTQFCRRNWAPAFAGARNAMGLCLITVSGSKHRVSPRP